MLPIVAIRPAVAMSSCASVLNTGQIPEQQSTAAWAPARDSTVHQVVVAVGGEAVEGGVATTTPSLTMVGDGATFRWRLPFFGHEGPHRTTSMPQAWADATDRRLWGVASSLCSTAGPISGAAGREPAAGAAGPAPRTAASLTAMHRVSIKHHEAGMGGGRTRTGCGSSRAQLPELRRFVIWRSRRGERRQRRAGRGGLREAERIQRRVAGRAASEHPHMAAWREAYRAFGRKPSRFPNSAEGLLGRVLRGDALPAINRLVDLYNAVSLKHVLPVGGEDLEQVASDPTLCFARGGEPFDTIRSGAPVVESVPPARSSG
jgi:hypothetical protein